MLEVGMPAPDFELPGVDGENVSLSQLVLTHPAVVLAFYLLDFSGT